MRSLSQLTLAFALVASLTTPAAAWGDKNINQKLEVGVGIICDTAPQVERYLTLQKEGQHTARAIQIVNDEAHNAKACGMAAIVFIPGEQVGNVMVDGGRMQVMRVTIVAVQTDRGWHATQPIVQHTAVFEKLEEV